MTTCPQCRRTSYNRYDETHQYCGACHQFYDTMTTDKNKMPPEVRAKMLGSYAKQFADQAAQHSLIAEVSQAMGADPEFVKLVADAGKNFADLHKRASEMLIKQATPTVNPHAS